MQTIPFHSAGTGLIATALRTMDEQIGQKLSNGCLIALLSMAFGVLVALLPGVGIFGVVRLAVISTGAALRVALAVSKLLQSQLFGVSAFDPSTLTCAVGLIAIVVAMAAPGQATRAASVDPTEALRVEQGARVS